MTTLSPKQLTRLRIRCAELDDYHLLQSPAEDGTVAFTLRCDRDIFHNPWCACEEEAWSYAPDYTTSRDSIIAAILRLPEEKQSDWSTQLANLVDSMVCSLSTYITAPAATMALAYVLTLDPSYTP